MSNATIDLEKVILTIGTPPYRITGSFGDGEYLRYSELSPTTTVLQGTNGAALVRRPRSGIPMRFEVVLLEDSPDNKFLAAALESGVALPLAFEDGETKVLGTAQIEGIPPSSKSTTGTTRTWVILAVNREMTYGAAASADGP